MDDIIAKDKIQPVCNIALAWLSIVFPPISAIQDSVNAGRHLSEILLDDKIRTILTNQDNDIDEWLKLSEKFEKDNKSYYKMVKQLIYHINAINEEDMLLAYSNLLRAYKSNQISKNDFLRLAFCLTKLLSEDAKYLSDNIGRDEIEENIYCLALSSNNLMYNKTRGFSTDKNGKGQELYCFTEMGRMLDKYALSYGDTEKYNYEEKAENLSEQTLEYEKPESSKWNNWD
ncbi:MAG: hypothetical protein ACLVLG_02500 [Anaerovoracaceae bacterium]